MRHGTPATTKLMVIFEENTDASSIYGSSSAPNINKYATNCGSAQNYQALTHPSLPNYMASTSGVSYASDPWTGDCDPGGSCLTGNDNVFHQVGASGWKAYAESMSSNCANSGDAYASKHNPAEYYTDVSAQCATNDVPMGSTTSGAFRSDVVKGTLPTFSTVTPNLNNDMHDGSIQQADSWLGGWIPQITGGPDYQAGHLTIVIVWDEGSGDGNVPSTVAMVAMSPYIAPGTKSSTHFTHSSLLKAAEDVAGVPELAGAASANNLRTTFGF
jgi:phosphatidylinositol-3-phosphatase